MLRIENLLTHQVMLGTNFEMFINKVKDNMKYDLETHEYHLIRNDKAKNFYIRFIHTDVKCLIDYVQDYKCIENEYIKIERVE